MNLLTPLSPAGTDSGSIALWAIGVLTVAVGYALHYLLKQVDDAKAAARRQHSLCEAQNAELSAKVDIQSGAYRTLQESNRTALIDLQHQSNRTLKDLASAINKLAHHRSQDETTDLPPIKDPIEPPDHIHG